MTLGAVTRPQNRISKWFWFPHSLSLGQSQHCSECEVVDKKRHQSSTLFFHNIQNRTCFIWWHRNVLQPLSLSPPNSLNFVCVVGEANYVIMSCWHLKSFGVKLDILGCFKLHISTTYLRATSYMVSFASILKYFPNQVIGLFIFYFHTKKKVVWLKPQIRGMIHMRSFLK